MSRDFNLDTHVIHAQPRHPDTRPDRLMVRHPLLEIPCHGLESFVVEGHMIRIDPEDLLPAFTTSVLQVEVHIGERLVDLRIEITADGAARGLPTA